MAERGEPYISLVVAARNDNHGGNMLGRMQAMLDSWIDQAEHCGLSSEIVVVEWNPPADRPRLKDSLRWPSGPKCCQVRLVEVSADLHARFRNAAAIPLHQMIAKNAGIRRARGEFVLATNLDIIFSTELMACLAERRLETGVMYRIDRHDVAHEIPPYNTVGELLAFCETHMLRVFAREGEFQLSGDGQRVLDRQDIAPREDGVRFGAGWSSAESSEGQRYRWVKSQAELFLERPAVGAPRLLLTAEVGPSAGKKPVNVEIVDEAGSTLAGTAITGRCQLRIQMPGQILSSRLLLRVRGSDLPLTRNPRIVNLRVLGFEWDRARQSADAASDQWLR